MSSSVTESRATVVADVPRVDGPRLLRDLAELARFGADDRGGVSRPGFSRADADARRHLIGRAEAAGLAAAVDPAGNLVVRRRRRTAGPVLLMGSHLDSVVHGGRLDGAYGVVAALEALRVLAGRDEPLSWEPVVVAFTNEEGARFPQAFWGSMALTGDLCDPRRAVDRDGVSIAGPLREAGGDLDRVADAAWPDGSIGAFLELHIEQGPVLERAGVPIGVVTSIVGRTLVEARVRGRQGHAGTTPMDLRRDAMAAAARVVLAVEELARSGACQVATVGALNPTPNVPNVIAGEVRMTAELRDTDEDRLSAAEVALRAVAERIGTLTGTTIELDPVMRATPVATDAGLRRVIARASSALDLPNRTVASGAGHDAQIMAAAAPIGMIFVPSVGGVSHAPDEHTGDRELVAGGDVLLRAAWELCRRGAIH
ncbi:hydantoinase/carbamoylase family amidase [Nonomuraea sp. NPDC001699]